LTSSWRSDQAVCLRERAVYIDCPGRLNAKPLNKLYGCCLENWNVVVKRVRCAWQRFCRYVPSVIRMKRRRTWPYTFITSLKRYHSPDCNRRWQQSTLCVNS
jgi:hypothetical protein